MNIISEGYRIPFTAMPPTFFKTNNGSALNNGDFVKEEILKLLFKGHIVELTAPAFVNNPLTVSISRKSKKRLILDLSWLNTYVVYEKFRLEDFRTLRPYLSLGGFLFCFDLSSGYHHCDIHEDFVKYLGFAWEFDGRMRYFAYAVLPFGLSSAPFIFTKLLRPIVGYWRSKGIRAVMYLDDGIVASENFDIAVRHSETVKHSLGAAGLVHNESKSVWEPVRCLTWLGLTVDLAEGSLTIPEERISACLVHVQRLAGMGLGPVTARMLAKVTGSLISMQPVFGPLVQLLTRFLHVEVATACSWDSPFLVSLKAQEELHFWSRNLTKLNKNCFFRKSQTQRLLLSDASATGAGALLYDGHSSFISHLQWTEIEATQSSTFRELYGVYFALASFGELVQGRNLKVYTDNLGVCSIIPKGSMKPVLHDIALKIYEFCLLHRVNLAVEWIPRSLNQQADAASRILDWDDHAVKLEYFEICQSRFGFYSFDRFANQFNAKTQNFNSRFFQPSSSGVDAFAFDWSGHKNWLCPPVNLIAQTIIHVQECCAEGTLVVPVWRSAQFWPMLFPSGDPAPFIRGIIKVPRNSSVFTPGRQQISPFAQYLFQSAVWFVHLAC